MTQEQVRKRKRICVGIVLVPVIVTAVHIIATMAKGNLWQQEAVETGEMVVWQQEPETFPVVQAERIHESEDVTEDKPATFATMSADWGAEVYEDGFVYFEIPEEYAENGGYFPERMQVYTYCLCQQYGVKYALIVAMIEHESGYRPDCIGDDGQSAGYMQIMEKWHADRMEELNCDDLTDPYQNVHVGIDWMKELLDRYGTIQDALTAYNYGEKGAREKMWNNGIYVYDYNMEIMSRMKEIEEELGIETDIR